MLGLVDRDLGKKTADRALRRKPCYTDKPLEDLIELQLPHVARPEDPHHQAVEHAQADLHGTVVFLPPLGRTETCEMVNYMQFVKEAPYKPCSAETCKILACEFLPRLTALVLLCCATLHLFGASFPRFQLTVFYQEWRLFTSKNSMLRLKKWSRAAPSL
jgi:hypothetical protein